MRRGRKVVMSIEEQLKLKTIIFLRNQNKELKDKIIKENNYDIKITEEIELEIFKALTQLKKKAEV